MSKKILGMELAYKQSLGERGNIALSCTLIVEMTEYIGEMETAIIDLKGSLRTCQAASNSVMDQYKDL
jgi:hypothetical protein